MRFLGVMTDKEWQDRLKGMVKAELAKRNINYVALAGLLEEAYGINETPQNLSNKIARGKFSAVFMVQILEAIGCENFLLSQ